MDCTFIRVTIFANAKPITPTLTLPLPLPLMPRSHGKTIRKFSAWDVAMLLQLRAVRGCYGVYVPFFFFFAQQICLGRFLRDGFTRRCDRLTKVSELANVAGTVSDNCRKIMSHHTLLNKFRENWYKNGVECNIRKKQKQNENTKEQNRKRCMWVFFSHPWLVLCYTSIDVETGSTNTIPKCYLTILGSPPPPPPLEQNKWEVEFGYLLRQLHYNFPRQW